MLIFPNFLGQYWSACKRNLFLFFQFKDDKLVIGNPFNFDHTGMRENGSKNWTKCFLLIYCHFKLCLGMKQQSGIKYTGSIGKVGEREFNLKFKGSETRKTLTRARR